MGLSTPVSVVTSKTSEISDSCTLQGKDEIENPTPNLPQTSELTATVVEMGLPTSERAAHMLPESKTRKASWSLHAREKELTEEIIAEKEKQYRAKCQEYCRKATVKTQITEKELGTLIWNKPCQNNGHARYFSLGQLSAVPGVLCAKHLFSQYKQSAPYSRWAIWTLVASALGTTVYGLREKMDPDQIFYNEQTGDVTFCNHSIFIGKPKYTVVPEGSQPKRCSLPLNLAKGCLHGLHRTFDGVAAKLKKAENRIPDKAPLVMVGGRVPICVKGCGVDEALIDRIFVSSAKANDRTDTEV